MAGMKGDDEGARNWNSFRTVVETIVCAGILWILRSVSNGHDETIAIRAKLDSLSTDNIAIKAALDKIPNLDTRATRMEVTIDDLKRRMDDLERRPKQNEPLKGWQR